MSGREYFLTAQTNVEDIILSNLYQFLTTPFPYTTHLDIKNEQIGPNSEGRGQIGPHFGDFIFEENNNHSFVQNIITILENLKQFTPHGYMSYQCSKNLGNVQDFLFRPNTQYSQSNLLNPIFPHSETPAIPPQLSLVEECKSNKNNEFFNRLIPIINIGFNNSTQLISPQFKSIFLTFLSFFYSLIAICDG